MATKEAIIGGLTLVNVIQAKGYAVFKPKSNWSLDDAKRAAIQQEVLRHCPKQVAKQYDVVITEKFKGYLVLYFTGDTAPSKETMRRHAQRFLDVFHGRQRQLRRSIAKIEAELMQRQQELRQQIEAQQNEAWRERSILGSSSEH